MAHGQLYYNQLRSGGVGTFTGTYVTVDSDAWKLLAFTDTVNGQLTLPATPPSTTWAIDVTNIGTATLTVSPNGLNLDGAGSTITLTQNHGMLIYTNGTNYFSDRGGGGTSLVLKTNGTANANQGTLNLVAGANITLTAGGTGDVSIAGTGGGSGGITPNSATGAAALASGLDQTGWTAVNGGIWNDFLSNSIGVYALDNVANNWRGAAKLISDYIGAASTYTIIAQIYCKTTESANAFANGVYLYDGTKLYGMEMLTTATADQLRIQELTNVTTASTTTFGPTATISPYLLSVKIVEDGTHRTWSYWKNGAWVQALQETTLTFLTPTKVMVGGISVTNNAGNYTYTELRYLNITHP